MDEFKLVKIIVADLGRLPVPIKTNSRSLYVHIPGVYTYIFCEKLRVKNRMRNIIGTGM